MFTKLIILIFNLVLVSTLSTQNISIIYNKIFALQAIIKKNFPDIPNEVFLKMFDASTKIPSGILNYNIYDLGNFDECYNLKYENKYGKYCLGSINVFYERQTYESEISHIYIFEKPSNLSENFSLSLPFHFAICVPSTVKAQDITTSLLKFTEASCYSKATKPQLSPGAISVIVILLLLAVLVVSSTAYDVILYIKEKKPHNEIFLAFSFWTNSKSLMKVSKNPDHFLCLNGFKAISMIWIVIGHEYSITRVAPYSNFKDVLDWFNNPANMILIGASFSVDTFLVIGGIVIVYCFLKAADKKIKFNILLFYFHRYLRLTPAFAITCFIHMYLFPYMGNGPLWSAVDSIIVEPCQRGWWSSLIYMNNYHKVGECLPQSWYLNVDMQLYFLSPIVLIPLTRWPKKTLAFISFLIVAGCFIPFGISFGNNYPIWMSSNFATEEMMMELYKQTYARFGPYVIGIVAGYLLYKIKKNLLILRLSKLLVAILWLVSLTGLLACIYGGYPLMTATEEDKWGNAFFNGFSKSAWAVCIAIIIILCVSGYGKPVDAFLSWPIFQIISKLSYSIYMVHYGIIVLRNASMKNGFKFSDLAMLHIFWSDFILSSAVAFILCLTFELPIPIIEKYLFGKQKSSKREQKSNEELPI